MFLLVALRCPVGLAARTGAEVVVVPNDSTVQIDTQALRQLADERTRLIGLTWVPTGGGLVNPAAGRSHCS